MGQASKHIIRVRPLRMIVDWRSNLGFFRRPPVDFVNAGTDDVYHKLILCEASFRRWRALKILYASPREELPTQLWLSPGSTAPALWERTSDFFAWTQSALSRVAFFAIAAVILGLVTTVMRQAFFRDPIVIEPVLAPKLSTESGWTGEMLARALRDAITNIHQGAGTAHSLKGILLSQEEVDIVLPGSTVSIHTLATLVRNTFRQPTTYLVAELIELSQNGDQSACPAGEGLPTPSRYSLRAHLTTMGRSFVECGDSIDELVRKCAI